ncbi:60 kDa neurofilament protein-like isoform X2 [Lineus longissimus]|uniref:60 kDa neurofilament protein-like isoform X2 n=1 Tax=Lineus longissimus TaxID=88925 RepID=UPI00315D4FBB
MATKTEQQKGGDKTVTKTTYRYESEGGQTREPIMAARPYYAINRTGAGFGMGGGGGGGSSMSMHMRSSMGASSMATPPGAYSNMSALGTANVQKNRKREKKDMQDLNERLASYIEKVRFLEAQNKKLAGELDDLRAKWGRETAEVKGIYEGELAQARKLLDESERERCKLELKVPSLQEELDTEKKRNAQMAKGIQDDKDKIENQHQQLSDYEGEINLLRRRINCLETESKKDKAEIKRLMDELTRAKQDLENETLHRVCAENDKQSLIEELEFLKNVHEQEMKELAALAYRDTTAENREFWKNELSQAIHDIQVEYECKLDGMRGELSAFYDAKMQEFRSGATRQNMESTHAKEEVKKLRCQISDLRAKLADLEAKNQGLEKLYNDAIRDLDEKEREFEIEKTEMRSEIDSLRAELESVLAELQNLLDAKLSLELEIAAYRKLLEGEETRIGLRSVVETVMGGDFSGGMGQEGGAAMKGEMSAKTTYQRSAKGNISVAECDASGKFIVFENTGKKDEVLEGWKVHRKIEGKAPVSFNVPRITIAGNKKAKIYGKGERPSGSSDLECDVKFMGVGGNIQTTLLNAEGEERATHTQRTTYSS